MDERANASVFTLSSGSRCRAAGPSRPGNAEKTTHSSVIDPALERKANDNSANYFGSQPFRTRALRSIGPSPHAYARRDFLSFP
jgi:hypothetical protein